MNILFVFAECNIAVALYLQKQHFPYVGLTFFAHESMIWGWSTNMRYLRTVECFHQFWILFHHSVQLLLIARFITVAMVNSIDRHLEVNYGESSSMHHSVSKDSPLSYENRNNRLERITTLNTKTPRINCCTNINSRSIIQGKEDSKLIKICMSIIITSKSCKYVPQNFYNSCVYILSQSKHIYIKIWKWIFSVISASRLRQGMTLVNLKN